MTDCSDPGSNRFDALLAALERLADVGERLVGGLAPPPPFDPARLTHCLACRWFRHGTTGDLAEVRFPDLPDHGDLLGIDAGLERLRRNTLQFVRGLAANDVLLWGERGSGKSSAVKGLLREFAPQGLRLVEVSKDDLHQLPLIIERLRPLSWRFVLFCDDLSFDAAQNGYRELKALLEGGISARPGNLLLYATSNRRHLLPERLADNSGEEEIHPEEAIGEKLSLSDRFGISIGFYPMSQETFFAVVAHLAGRRGLALPRPELERRALQWSLARGSRSGRVARQFVDDLSGHLALGLDP